MQPPQNENPTKGALAAVAAEAESVVSADSTASPPPNKDSPSSDHSDNASYATNAENAEKNPGTPNLSSLNVRLTQNVAVSALIALIILSVTWELWLAPIREGGSWLCLKALPLCIPLTGLLKNRMYTYRWLSLWIWFYFTEGVVRSWGDTYPSNLLAAGEVLICLILFGACALHVRFRFESAKMNYKPTDTLTTASTNPTNPTIHNSTDTQP